MRRLVEDQARPVHPQSHTFEAVNRWLAREYRRLQANILALDILKGRR